MKAISLHLDDEIFSETEQLSNVSKISRNKYINEALAYYNQIKKRYYLANKFKEASALVSESSMATLKEFEELNDNDEEV